MLIARIMTSAAAVLALSVVSVAPAGAGLVNPPKYRDAFDDDICGIAAHVVISADNPIVDTGRLTASGEPASVDTGHLDVRFTNIENGHWMEDDFSGPARVVSNVVNTDGTVSKRVIFSGTKRIFTAWDGAVVADRGRLVVDYLIKDDEILSRTEVSRVGDFPIASGAVGFCDFAGEHLA